MPGKRISSELPARMRPRRRPPQQLPRMLVSVQQGQAESGGGPRRRRRPMRRRICKAKNKARHAAHIAGYFRRNRSTYAARSYRWRLNPENAAKVRAYKQPARCKAGDQCQGIGVVESQPGRQTGELLQQACRLRSAAGRAYSSRHRRLSISSAGGALLPRQHSQQLPHESCPSRWRWADRTAKTNLQLLCPTCNLKRAQSRLSDEPQNGRLLLDLYNNVAKASRQWLDGLDQFWNQFIRGVAARQPML